MAEAVRNDDTAETVEAVARLLEESSFGTAGAQLLRDRASAGEAAETRARAYVAADPSGLAWWKENRSNPAALRIRAARLASRGNLQVSAILAQLADWHDSQEHPRPSPSPPRVESGEGWRTFEIFYRREYGSLCAILSERVDLPRQLSEKLITRAMREAFDDWENVEAAGDLAEWVLGGALQHYRTLGLPDEDSSWTQDPLSSPATDLFPGAPPRGAQATAVRVAGALATQVSLAPVLCTTEVASWAAEEMLTDLYTGYYNQLVRLALLLVHDLQTAEEVVQDAFEAMHRGWRRLHDPDKALAYLRQTVVNRSRSVLRHRKATDLHQPKAAPDEPGAEHAVIALIERSTVISALRQLPERQREAIVLRYYADLGEADIARAMGISRGAVKSHTARAMATLKSVLETETPSLFYLDKIKT
jgi:RNA polymerase sigma-70 factor (sigma-E family)